MAAPGKSELSMSDEEFARQLQQQFDEEESAQNRAEEEDYKMAQTLSYHDISDSGSDSDIKTMTKSPPKKLGETDTLMVKRKMLEKQIAKMRDLSDSDVTLEPSDDEDTPKLGGGDLNMHEPKSASKNTLANTSLHDISDSGSDDDQTRSISKGKSKSSHKIPSKSTPEKTQQGLGEDDTRPVCEFGSQCYRKNPSHLAEFRHPGGKQKTRSFSGESSPAAKKARLEKAGPSGGRSKCTGSGATVEDSQPLGLLLTKVHGIDEAHNRRLAVNLRDLLHPSMGNLQASAQFNYMFDIPWLMNHYPKEFRDKPLLIVHGDQREAKSRLDTEAMNFSNIRLCQARLDIMYGTHHTKMMFLLYDTGMRVVVHTANMVEQDWFQRTQGVWVSPLFPKLPKGGSTVGDSPSGFKKDLLQYLSAYQSNHLNTWQKHIEDHDMSTARVHLIASVPGRHTGEKKTWWGHLKLRKVLQQHGPEASTVKDWPVIGQFSSIGTLGDKDKWLFPEWHTSLSKTKGGATVTSRELRLIFPSKENVRTSLEGYPAGVSLPYSIKVATKQQWLHSYFHVWKSSHRGRSHASPHIKTYLRTNSEGSRAAWYLVTSANLSKAAWGALEKQQSQLMIRSYELGVLLLPQHFGVKLFSTYKDGDNRAEVMTLPLPFDLPTTPYAKTDRPWIWDIPYVDKPDTHMNKWCPR